jgi:glutathione S-transferase
MKLIGANASPYTRKVRIVLAEKKIKHTYETEDVWKADTVINLVNPLGKVPALMMDDGGAVFDSRVIVEYLDNLSPLHKMIPDNGRQRVEVRCWEALSDGLLDAAILVRLENTQRTEAQRSAPWIARQMKKIELSLNSMSHGLSDHDWCSGNKYSLADVSVGCALGYLDFRFAQLNWRGPHANLAKLFDKLSLKKSFIETMPNL